MISLEDVAYSYGGRLVLRGVSVAAAIPGRLTLVVGPNGAGKTTLLKIASLLYKPLNGRVLIEGVDYWGLKKQSRLAYRRRVVYVHEKPSMLRGTVLDNIVYGLTLRGVPRDKAVRRALEEARLLGIDKLSDAYARKLSTGQQQLVAIARALAVDPDYVFLDEPFAHLDRKARERLVKRIKTIIDEGKAATIATHDTVSLRGVELRARILFVENGAVVDEWEE